MYTYSTKQQSFCMRITEDHKRSRFTKVHQYMRALNNTKLFFWNPKIQFNNITHGHIVQKKHKARLNCLLLFIKHVNSLFVSDKRCWVIEDINNL